MTSAKPIIPPEEPSPQVPKTTAPAPSSPPFHVVPGLSNFRDVGGWPITTPHSQNPRRVRKGILFRGSDTTRITPDGISKLNGLGIKTDFDLRSKQQIKNTGGIRVMEGIERIWAPVFDDEAYTEEKAKERYELYASDNPKDIVEAFMEILVSGATMMRTVMQHLVTSDVGSEAYPALFMHCTTGNNRTGVFIALLLLLLHVPAQCIVHEYTLSEQGLAPSRHINVQRLLKKGAFEEYGPVEAKRRCEKMVGARPESMEALLDEVHRRFGGAQGYFRTVVGLSDEEIAKVIDILTEEGESHVPESGGSQL